MFIPHPNSSPRGSAKSSRTYKAGAGADCAGETVSGCMTSICKEDILRWLTPSFERRSVMALALASVDSPCTSPLAAAVVLVGSSSGAAGPVLMFSSGVAFNEFVNTCVSMGPQLSIPRLRGISSHLAQPAPPSGSPASPSLIGLILRGSERHLLKSRRTRARLKTFSNGIKSTSNESHVRSFRWMRTP